MKVTYEIENGKKVKVKTYDNVSVYKYDSNGNEIHYKDNRGYEDWSEYDAKGNKIYYKNKIGYEKCITRTITNMLKYEITGEYIKECNSEV